MASIPNLLPEEFLEDVARRRGLSAYQLQILKLLFSEGLSIKQAASSLGSIRQANAISKQLGKVYVIFGITSGSSKGKKNILRTQLCESFIHWERKVETDRSIDEFEGILEEVFSDTDVTGLDFHCLKPEFIRMAEIVGSPGCMSQEDNAEIMDLLNRVIQVAIHGKHE